MTMKSFATLAFLSLIAGTNAIELTPDNWDIETAGKTVLIKFFAPWCGHCKKMKPDWDKLMDVFDGSAGALVADVDCTTEGKLICDDNGVRGYPSIKWGDPEDLEDYEGGRDYDSLKKFAEESLKPICSASNIDHCDADKKAEIEKYMAMSDADLDAAIAAKVAEVKTAGTTFNDEVAKIQATYQGLLAAKEKTIEDVNNSGLGLMQSVKGAKPTGTDEL